MFKREQETPIFSDTGNNEVEFRFDDFLKRYDFHLDLVEKHVCVCIF